MRTAKTYQSIHDSELTLTVTPINRPNADYEAVLSHPEATAPIYEHAFLWYTPDEIASRVEDAIADKYGKRLDLTPVN